MLQFTYPPILFTIKLSLAYFIFYKDGKKEFLHMSERSELHLSTRCGGRQTRNLTHTNPDLQQLKYFLTQLLKWHWFLEGHTD